MKVKLTVLKSKCRSHHHQAGDTFIIDNLCPPICHELWQCIYPSVYALLNHGSLDLGDSRAKEFRFACPDHGRVLIQGEVYREDHDAK